MSSTTPQSRDRHGIRFTLLEAIRPEQARFTFTGPFQGQDIRWDATLVTLASSSSHTTEIPSRPFIEIGELSPQGRVLIVGLDIPVIDEPAILRTIIMIRQYKRLRFGRHEFGEPPGS